MADLEKQLQKCNPDSVKLIIVDGVFSMEGDLANLPETVRLKHKYNATIMVDEAHGLGAVSYTHLDVYKRQPFMMSISSTNFMPKRKSGLSLP